MNDNRNVILRNGNDQYVDDILNLYNEGFSIKQINKKIPFVSKATIWRMTKRAGVTRTMSEAHQIRLKLFGPDKHYYYDSPKSLEIRKQYGANFQLKYEAIQFLGGLCKSCNESNFLFLTINHVNHDGYKRRYSRNLDNVERSGTTLNRNLLQGNVDKSRFSVLCWNCNFIEWLNWNKENVIFKTNQKFQNQKRYHKLFTLTNGEMKCICCGYSKDWRALSIDHIDGNHSNKDDLNIQVLCRNCNGAKRNKSICPHKELIQ